MHFFAATLVTNSISSVIVVRTVSIAFIGLVDDRFKDRNAVLSFRLGVLFVSGFCLILELISDGNGLSYSRIVLLNVNDAIGL